MKCSCGAEKVGSAEHSEWCDAKVIPEKDHSKCSQYIEVCSVDRAGNNSYVLAVHGSYPEDPCYWSTNWPLRLDCLERKLGVTFIDGKQKENRFYVNDFNF